MIVHMHSLHQCVYMQHIKQTNEHTHLQVNDMFTPKPAKLDKHICTYTDYRGGPITVSLYSVPLFTSKTF